MEEVVELPQARRALDAFGAVHVVCNNASVAIGGPVGTRTVEDWQWVLGVNLWSVIHGVRVSTPVVLAPPPRPRQGCFRGASLRPGHRL